MSQQKPNDGKKKDDKKKKPKSEASTSNEAKKKKDYRSRDKYYTPISSSETLVPAKVPTVKSTASVYYSLESESEIEKPKGRKPESKPKSPARKKDKDAETERAKRTSLPKLPTAEPQLPVSPRTPQVDSPPILASAGPAGVTTQDDAEREEAKRTSVPKLRTEEELSPAPSIVLSSDIFEEPLPPRVEMERQRKLTLETPPLVTSSEPGTDSSSQQSRRLRLAANRVVEENRRSKLRSQSVVSILKPSSPMRRDLVDDGTQSSSSEYGLTRFNADARLTTNLAMGTAFIYMVIPPDGGFGWIIMVISFLCQVIVDGIIFSVGILLPEMARELGVAQSTIVLVASIQIGSFSSAFINRFGFRPVALAGTICSCVAIYIATYATSLSTLIFFYSVIGGPALSMIWVSSQLIIGYYFERYRPIANGLSCSGAGAGIIIFCALNSALVPSIGWRQMSRIHVAILVSVLIMALTYSEVAATKVGTMIEPELETDTDQEELMEQFGTVRYSLTFSVRSAGAEKMFEHMIEKVDKPRSKKRNICRRWVEKCCPALRRRRDVDDAEFTTKKYVIRPDPMEKQDLFYMGPADYNRNNDEYINDMGDGRNIELLASRAKSVNYALSLMHAAGPGMGRASTVSVKMRQSLASRRRTTIEATKLTWGERLSPSHWVPEKMMNAFRKLFDLNLLSTMEFRVLLASAFFYPMGFNIPFLYSKARAEVGTLHGSMIAPVIGLSNFIFRIASGFLGQRYKLYTTYICGGGIFFGGFFVFLSAFYGEDVIWFQYLYAFCYGIAPAFYSTLRAIIYVRSLGLDRLTNAFGLTAMAMGLGVFVGTTCAGYLNEFTGGYSVSFMFAGVNLMIAGGLKLILPTLIIWKDRRLSTPKRR